MKRITSSLLLCLILSACATPVAYTTKPMQAYDKDTQYNIEESEQGYTVNIVYERWQFVSESPAVATACKSNLLGIAHEHADKIGKRIKNVNEQRIKISLARNYITGVSTCSASAMVEYE